MSENNDGVSDANSEVSDEASNNTVPYKAHEKLLRQRKEDNEKLKNAQSRLKEFEDREALEQEAKLQEAGQWKEALEVKNSHIQSRDEKITSLETDLNEMRSNIDTSVKLHAVLDKLPGKIKKSEYYNFIDTSKVLIDPDTGAVDEESALNAANSFAKDWGSDLLKPDKGGKLPSDAPGGTRRLSHADFKKMSLEDKKKNMKQAHKDYVAKQQR